MRTVFTPLFIIVSVGCSTSEFRDSQSFDQLTSVRADVEQGDFDYRGRTNTSAVKVDLRSYGNGGSKSKADSKQEGNTWDMQAADGLLDIFATSTYVQAGVDFDLIGPLDFTLDVIADSGNITVSDVVGYANLTGRSVSVTGFEGDLDISASGDLTLEVYPFESGSILAMAKGSTCIVYLPMYAPVAVTINFDPEQVSAFTDLGWDDEYLTDGYFEGTRMPGDITVDINCPNGSVDLRQHSLGW